MKFLVITLSTLFFILSSTLTSCGQSSIDQTSIFIKKNEMNLIFNQEKRYVLESGEYEIDKISKVITFRKIDSLVIDEFDILDSNSRRLYCQIHIKYTLTAKQIENIADLLEWVQSIKSYKELLLTPKIKSVIRDVASNFEANELKLRNNKFDAEIKKKLNESLDNYINILSFKLNTHKK